MRGRLGQPADCADQLFPAELSCLCQRSALDQFSEGRRARHRGDAALRAKTDVGDPVGLKLYRESQDISAGGILELG